MIGNLAPPEYRPDCSRAYCATEQQRSLASRLSLIYQIRRSLSCLNEDEGDEGDCRIARS